MTGRLGHSDFWARGVIGGGWAARALHFGIDVIAGRREAGDGGMDPRRGGQR
mgnify:CR=1 FL=1